MIRRWLIRAPIPADRGDAGVVKDYAGGESALLPDVGAVVAGGSFVEVDADSAGRVDLNAIAGPSDWSAAYAHTYVFAATERTVRLVMDSDDDLVAWVNGQRVWLHVVPRGIGSGRDTAAVRFAEGWNSVLLKVINRTGGFDLLARLADAPGGGQVADLRLATARPRAVTAHHYPAASVAVGPLRVSGRLQWRNDQLGATATIPVTAWGPDSLHDVSITLEQKGERVLDRTFPTLRPGDPTGVELATTFAVLQRAAVGDAPVTAVMRWVGGSARVVVAVDPEPLLRLYGGEVDLPDLTTDSAAGRVTRFAGTVVVPTAFGGLSLDLNAVGLGRAASYRVAGRPVEWRDGVVTLCAPCRAGESIAITVTPDAERPVWMPPFARIREAGFAEFADGYRYARALASRLPAIEPPEGDEWLAAVGTPRLAELRTRYEEAFAPVAAELRRDTLFLVGNSHIDAAWLWRWRETIDVVRNTWRTSLKLAELFPGYIFAGSAAAYYDAMDRVEPTLADTLVASARAGTWAPVGGWWVEADMNLPSGESLVRQGLYGQRYFQRRFGRRSRVAWTPDTFGYPWTVPQVLRQSGFDYFVTQKIRWNDSTDFPHNAFVWEGLDGSRIFTYNPYGYTHDLDPASLVRERLEDRERTGGHNQIVLYGVGDHGGGPTIAMLRRAEHLRRVPAFPVMTYADPPTALDRVSREPPAAGFALWRDELYLEFHRGTYTSQAAMKQRNRRSEAMLQTAEALAVLDTAAYPRRRLEAAWRAVLFNQFHDILPGSGIDSVYLDANATYDTAWARIDSVTHAAFAGLRRQLDTRGPNRAVVVFNPLGWPRDGIVPVVDAGADTVWLPVRDVPALGAVVVPMSGRPADAGADLPAPRAGPTWIENAYLRVEIDTGTGSVTRLYDKARRREALASDGYANRLQVLDDRPQQWDAWNVMPHPETWDVDAVQATSSDATAREARFHVDRSWGASRFRQTLVLGRAARHLDVLNEVSWHERRKLLKVAFAFAPQPDSATFEIPYGAIGRSGRPRTPLEDAKFEVPGQRWADVSSGEYGVSILNDAKYGWDYREGVLRLSLLKAPIWPDSTADRGHHRFRFAIYPHIGDWRTGETARRGAEYNVPMLAAVEPAHGGRLGPRTSLATAAPTNVEIAWIKRAEDSGDLVLRLVERHGLATTAQLTLGCPVLVARRANLLEDPDQPLHASEDRVTIHVHGYEIATILVRCGT